jgi:hypothetical protein
MKHTAIHFIPSLTLLLFGAVTLAASGCESPETSGGTEEPGTEDDAVAAAAKTTVTASSSKLVDAAGNQFEQLTLLSGGWAWQAYSPSFITVADVNADGHPDLVVSQFGPFFGVAPPGKVTVLYSKVDASGKVDPSHWDAEVVVPLKDLVLSPNRTTVADVNKDGLPDIVVPSGFLASPGSGALAWYEQLAGGGWKRHSIVSGQKNAAGQTEFFHEAIVDDVDDDGTLDILAVGETAKTQLGGSSSATVNLYRGDKNSADRFLKTATVLASGGGSLPTYHDVDGDGKKDLVAAQYFVPGETFAWYKNVGAAGPWPKHVMDTQHGPGIDLLWVDGLYAPGKGGYVGANHTNTADDKSSPESDVFLVRPAPGSTTVWSSAPITAGVIQSRKSVAPGKQAAPGVLGAGDIDGDGLPDITVSGDGDSRVFWLKNKGNGQFVTIPLAGVANTPVNAPFGQCGGMNVFKLDKSDKNACIAVTSYEGNTVSLLCKQ